MSEPFFHPEHVRRRDERDDALFYAEARLVAHIDEAAMAAAQRLYAELLPAGGDILDMMSSWKSHLPDHLPRNRTVGLGMNELEMREKPQLDAWVVHDVNCDPCLPFGDAEIDGGVMTVSVQYLTQTVAVFREMRRVLRPGAPFIVAFSHRIFPEKAVAIWPACTTEERARLVGAYFYYAGGWAGIVAQDRSPNLNAPTDPLYGAWARVPGEV